MGSWDSCVGDPLGSRPEGKRSEWNLGLRGLRECTGGSTEIRKQDIPREKDLTGKDGRHGTENSLTSPQWWKTFERGL